MPTTPAPLTPASQAIVDQMGQMNDMASVDPVAFRQQRESVIRPNDPADRVTTVHADADGVPVRIYRREDAGNCEPVMVFYHGGGFVACSAATHESLCHRLARLAECAIVSVDYRLAPEFPFPAAVDDAMTALRWVGEHGHEYGLDSGRIVVGGDSAGGNLAAVTAIRVRDEGGPLIHHQLLIYPSCQPGRDSESQRLYGKGYFLEEEFSERCLNAYLPNADHRTHPWVAPLLGEDFCALPPATVITAECDPIRDDGKSYAEALNAAGVSASYSEYPGVFHGFFSMYEILPEGAAAVAEAAQALRDAFGRIAGPLPLDALTSPAQPAI